MKKNWLNFFLKAIWILFAMIITYLLLGSVFSTSYIGNLEYISPNNGKIEVINEHTFFIRDAWWIHIVIFVIFSLLLVHIDIKNSRLIEVGCCVFAFILALIVVFLANRYPWSDQRNVMEIASAFNNGDYSALEKGGYLYVFPFQYGIVLFYQICSLIFGNNNWLAFQALNAFFIGLTYYFLIQIMKRINFSFFRFSFSLCISFFFTPYLFYTTWVYGNVVGLLFAVASFYCLLKFDENNRMIYMFIGCTTIIISIILKSNCQIFLIAEMIFLLFSIFSNFENKKIILKKGIFILLLICGFVLSRYAVNYQIEKLAGKPIKGCPMVTWIAMGMQDWKLAPGWYNGYNNGTYEKNDYDYEATKSDAMESIRNTIKKYPESITTALGFYSQKIMSMWNNPLFQGLWIIEVEQEGDSGLEFLLGGIGRYIYTWITNVLHTWILVGVFLYCIFGYREMKYQMILLPITFIGGFVFHIFWEGKCTYAMPYFLLLIPLCVLGYQYWRAYLLSGKNELVFTLSKVGFGFLLICLLSNTKVFIKLIARDDDTQIFNTYTQETVSEIENDENISSNNEGNEISDNIIYMNSTEETKQ